MAEPRDYGSVGEQFAVVDAGAARTRVPVTTAGHRAAVMDAATEPDAAVARVLHAVYQLPGGQRGVGWRRDDWIANLRDRAPRVASVMVPGRRARVVFDFLAELRNLIHAESLGVTSLNTSSERYPRIVIEEPETNTRRACEEWILGKAGGLEELNGSILVEVPKLVEAVLPLLTQTMNVVMARAEVERLPDVDAADVHGAPTPDDQLAYVHRAVQRLAGL